MIYLLLVVASLTANTDQPSHEVMLNNVERAYEALECETVLREADALLEQEPVLEVRLRVYLLRGSCLAILGDTVTAETPFRLLVRGDPDFELDADVSPKIRNIFGRVKAEETSIARQLAEMALARLAESISLESDLPAEPVGGEPLAFALRLRDPHAAIARASIHYRKDASGAFSALALERDESGVWTGEIAPDWTANKDGLEVTYYLTTANRELLPLMTLGSETDPLRLEIAPGDVARGEPFYRTYWFWSLVGAAAIAVGVTTWIVIDRRTQIDGVGGHDPLEFQSQ